jgi:hypothetical protein
MATAIKGGHSFPLVGHKFHNLLTLQKKYFSVKVVNSPEGLAANP